MINQYRTFIILITALILIWENSYSITATQDPNKAPIAEEPAYSSDPLWDSASVARFFDQLFEEEMEARHVPGGTGIRRSYRRERYNGQRLTCIYKGLLYNPLYFSNSNYYLCMV